ncbi:MAG TPA: hypothetical protein VK324_06330 [Tepidisphaeraceae bacterium]|nr:hypothetical protein [Tepidisphaeraceae bacterium]
MPGRLVRSLRPWRLGLPLAVTVSALLVAATAAAGRPGSAASVSLLDVRTDGAASPGSRWVQADLGQGRLSWHVMTYLRAAPQAVEQQLAATPGENSVLSRKWAWGRMVITHEYYMRLDRPAGTWRRQSSVGISLTPVAFAFTTATGVALLLPPGRRTVRGWRTTLRRRLRRLTKPRTPRGFEVVPSERDR